MEPLLLNFNENKYKATVSSLYGYATWLQDVIDSYNNIEGIEQFKKEDFNELFFEHENLIYKKIMKDSTVKVNGMKVNKRRFWDEFVEKPEGYYSFINKMTEFKKKTDVIIRLNSSGLWSDFKNFLNTFDFSDDGEIVVKPAVLETEREKNETYIMSETAKQAFELAVKMKEFLSTDFLKKIGAHNRNLISDFYNGILNLNDFTVEINIDYLTSLDRKALGK